MAATTTRLPISVEEVNGSSIATVVNPGSLPVEVLEPVEIAPGQVVGIDSAANTIKINQTAGNNGVDIVKINGTAISGSSIPVVFSASGVAKNSHQSFTGVSANLGTATLNFSVITTGTTGKLTKASFSSQTQMKIELQTFDGTTANTFAVLHIPAGGGTCELDTPSDDYVTFSGGATNRFRAVITNLDKSKSADIFGTCFWAEV